MSERQSNQERLDGLLERAAANHRKLTDKQVRFAIREIDRTRLELNDLLADYAKKDNTIATNRLNSLLRDLETLEQSVRKNGMDAMESAIRESGMAGITGGEGALIKTVGQSAAIGANFNRLNNDVFRYVVNRFGDDGLVLSDRIWQLAGDQRDALNTVLRSAIIRGESVSSTIARVREVYANETWKIRRLVVTETNVAYRTGASYLAQRSEFVKGLRIHRGKANRPNHRCTQLELANDYGLGQGVYPPDNTAVLNPHVNCTSFTTYELID
ncbi:MAG: hypothetical protein ACQEV7_07775 [Bacillota bacterium]